MSNKIKWVVEVILIIYLSKNALWLKSMKSKVLRVGKLFPKK